jgi:hypothetical protein
LVCQSAVLKQIMEVARDVARDAEVLNVYRLNIIRYCI